MSSIITSIVFTPYGRTNGLEELFRLIEYFQSVVL